MRLHFDGLTFDADTRQIWLRGSEVRLSPKAFDLLALLIERRPRAVSKDEIGRHLWPGTFVSESSLPSLVSEIRDAIADQTRTAGLIRTIRRFGYAFQGELRPDARQPGFDRTGRYSLIGATQQVALLSGENVIGREGADVIDVKSSSVSRRHARILVGADGAAIEDLGSKNGTYVNDRQVSGPTRLTDGDQVRIATLLFTFRLLPESQSTETQSSHSGTRLRS